ncbi:MAG: hypothetical protein LBR28_04425 [Bacteroidales bacterium]|jgi:hypothetical protein|nr:hypothetical protein [Bacteroidales bacterium]
MAKNNKKRLIISYHNLSEELQAAFNELYSEGYTDKIQKITKPNGSNIFVVPFETEDVSYMVKIDVKIDEHLSDEDFEKDLFNVEGDEDDMGSVDEEGKESKSKIVLMHGDYSTVDRADLDDTND